MSGFSGIFQGDLVIKTAVELGFDDFKKNPWLIQDVFASLLDNSLLSQKYGIAEVTRATEFLLNNDIPIFLEGRMDKETLPCITISVGESAEMDDATLSDQSFVVEELEPGKIGKPITYIIPPFDIVSYDPDTGIIEVPENVANYPYISAGMIAVFPKTGKGFIIQEGRSGQRGFKIEAGSVLPKDKLGIVPQYQIWRARRERMFSQESFTIGCHVHGDPSTLIFLFSAVKYCIWRYKESLLEANNFQLARLSCSPLMQNDKYQADNVYSRFITLTGQVEESWIKSPYRVIEAIDAKEEPTLNKGIKIISKKKVVDPNDSDELWTTIDE